MTCTYAYLCHTNDTSKDTHFERLMTSISDSASRVRIVSKLVERLTITSRWVNLV